MWSGQINPMLRCVSALEILENTLRHAAEGIRDAHSDPLWIGPARYEYESTKESVAEDLLTVAWQAQSLAANARWVAESEAALAAGSYSFAGIVT